MELLEFLLVGSQLRSDFYNRKTGEAFYRAAQFVCPNPKALLHNTKTQQNEPELTLLAPATWSWNACYWQGRNMQNICKGMGRGTKVKSSENIVGILNTRHASILTMRNDIK